MIQDYVYVLYILLTVPMLLHSSYVQIPANLYTGVREKKRMETKGKTGKGKKGEGVVG